MDTTDRIAELELGLKLLKQDLSREKDGNKQLYQLLDKLKIEPCVSEVRITNNRTLQCIVKDSTFGLIQRSLDEFDQIRLYNIYPGNRYSSDAKGFAVFIFVVKAGI